MRTEASRLFDEFNRKYWRNRLPKYRVIRRATLRGECLGICSNQTKTILLRRDLAGEDLRLTLLHEMCHIGTDSWCGHGPRFLRKVHRLRRLGEPRLLDDIERYDGTKSEREIEALRAQGKLDDEPIPFRVLVHDDLKAAALEQYRRPWKTIRRLLANQYEMSPAQFQKFAPWAERKWREASQQYRRIEHGKRAFRKRTQTSLTPAP